MYVVTRCINAYDQDGEYFVCAYENKPTTEQLKEATGLQEVSHLYKNGGRISFEDEWFYLTFVEDGYGVSNECF